VADNRTTLFFYVLAVYFGAVRHHQIRPPEAGPAGGLGRMLNGHWCLYLVLLKPANRHSAAVGTHDPVTADRGTAGGKARGSRHKEAVPCCRECWAVRVPLGPRARCGGRVKRMP